MKTDQEFLSICRHNNHNVFCAVDICCTSSVTFRSIQHVETTIHRELYVQGQDFNLNNCILQNVQDNWPSAVVSLMSVWCVITVLCVTVGLYIILIIFKCVFYVACV